MQWADEELRPFLGCRETFIHKRRDGKSSQHQIIRCCLMGSFLIPLAKVVFSDVRSGGAGVTHSLYCDWVFSQILSFWQLLCFHRLLFLSLYLQGDVVVVVVVVRSG